MQILKNYPLKGKHKRPIVTDLFYNKNGVKKPLVIFVHGYKGYKDWGVFGKMNEAFLEEGFALLKFNFSHNGGTPEQVIDFPDLEAFGQNNYSIEYDDLQTVIDWITKNNEHHHEIDTSNIILIGHSRGGGMVTLTAGKDPRIKKVVSWAAVCTLSRSMFQEGDELDQWKKEGVLYIENGRTKQQMPHYIQFYEDFIKNKERLNIKTACKNITIPHLIIHGDGDIAVPFSHAEKLHEWNPNSELCKVSNANHVFGAKQPWEASTFPEDFDFVLKKTFEFLHVD
ncbi:alpha/beta fold hydrolase [Pseudotenacibaculum sp. MALMAid0570]|uniref:alpha/beta hydrolase family protein n=1 Tax=Pseudotenacibaculum sp. MALMAid0570 TaxID=3143938 RepID=UPI0032E02088